ncbi:Maf family protein [Sphingomonas sp. F9_3S_D5_B_2]
MTLILASGSQIRHQMLAGAGIEHRVVKPDVDEALVKARLSVPEEVASDLAAAKALTVSSRNLEDWAIGSDSVLSIEGRLFDKPADRAQATDHLRYFSGKTMQLTSAVALARRGAAEWRYVETAELHVRPLSDTFISEYLDEEWPEVSYCVGVFRMEARGVQLFSSLRGDYFTILGMPLLPLLGALREREVIPS